MRSKIIVKCYFVYNLKNVPVEASVSLHLSPNIQFTSGYVFKMTSKKVRNVRWESVCCTQHIFYHELNSFEKLFAHVGES
jgi:hypothetical protein